MTSFQCNGNNSRILFSIFRRMSPSWCLNMAFTSLLETKIGSQTSASMWDENLFTISTCNKKTYKYKNTHGQQQRKTQFKCSKWNIRIGFRIKHKSSKERKDISRALSWFTFFRASSTPKCLCNTGGKEALFKCHKIKIAIFARPPWEEIFWDYHRCDKPYIIIHRYSAGNEKCHILQQKKRGPIWVCGWGYIILEEMFAEMDADQNGSFATRPLRTEAFLTKRVRAEEKTILSTVTTHSCLEEK